mmetsp:Transcript_2070/g.4647  ORF Transcript_2070/g.4647 Transcript_2070/m.4647 type:complete len:289 (+) Transcript_2070:714-1580(+)
MPPDSLVRTSIPTAPSSSLMLSPPNDSSTWGIPSREYALKWLGPMRGVTPEDSKLPLLLDSTLPLTLNPGSTSRTRAGPRRGAGRRSEAVRMERESSSSESEAVNEAPDPSVELSSAPCAVKTSSDATPSGPGRWSYMRKTPGPQLNPGTISMSLTLSSILCCGCSSSSAVMTASAGPNFCLAMPSWLKSLFSLASLSLLAARRFSTMLRFVILEGKIASRMSETVLRTRRLAWDPTRLRSFEPRAAWARGKRATVMVTKTMRSAMNPLRKVSLASSSTSVSATIQMP